jgi:hypothetical protein
MLYVRNAEMHTLNVFDCNNIGFELLDTINIKKPFLKYLILGI